MGEDYTVAGVWLTCGVQRGVAAREADGCVGVSGVLAGYVGHARVGLACCCARAG